MKKDRPAMKLVLVQMPPAMLRRLDNAAKLLGISRSGVVQIAVRTIIYATDDDFGPRRRP